jgi:hypothetical protein
MKCWLIEWSKAVNSCVLPGSTGTIDGAVDLANTVTLLRLISAETVILISKISGKKWNSREFLT